MGNDQAYQRLAFRIFADFSGTIAIPVVLAALLGKWLDGRYGTSPKLVIACLALSFVLTAVIVVRKAKRYSKEYERLSHE